MGISLSFLNQLTPYSIILKRYKVFNQRPRMFSCFRLRKRQHCCKPKIGGETKVTNKLSLLDSSEFVGAISDNTSCTHCHTLFLYYLFHHLYLLFLFFFFNFHSFHSLYFFLFYSFFFYFLPQPMLILTGLSWCPKFQLHFMSLMPQIKGTFIKIERFNIGWRRK